MRPYTETAEHTDKADETYIVVDARSRVFVVTADELYIDKDGLLYVRNNPEPVQMITEDEEVACD
jgi:hypothetical protein